MSSGLAAQQPACKPTVVGDLRVEKIDSAIFPGPHTLRVWLPPGYSEPANAQRTYPVLYMLDGEKLFDVCTSPYHSEWQIDEALTKLVGEGKVEPMIVVGIDSPGDDDRRANELLPMADPASPNLFEPQGTKFPKFLMREIMPRIAAEFRVKAGRVNTGIGGCSYGGIAALNALLTLPNTFGLGLIESPSLHVGNGAFVRETEHLSFTPLRLYIGVGTNETGNFPGMLRKAGYDPEVFNRTFAHNAELLAENFRNSGDLPAVKFVEAPGAKHEEAAWRQRFPAAIEFLFPARPR
jgi:predicted alpha/beta superfamily hydrolase